MKEKIRSKHHPIKELIAALEDIADLTQVHGIFFGPITISGSSGGGIILKLKRIDGLCVLVDGKIGQKIQPIRILTKSGDDAKLVAEKFKR